MAHNERALTCFQKTFRPSEAALQSSRKLTCLKQRSIYRHSKTLCLCYSEPTVDHEVFIPRLAVTEEVLCRMETRAQEGLLFSFALRADAR